MKNTIFLHFSEIICPHYCILCGKSGAILCGRCKKYILLEHKDYCLACGGALENGHCEACDLPFQKQFWVGKREGALKKLIEIYKYQSVRACSWTLADLLSSVADFEPDMKVVALPTIGRHIRERGFDHMAKLAQKVAQMNDLEVAKVLVRGNNAVQVGASMKKRKEQAKTAYVARSGIDMSASYLLIDDVWTTGSSMLAAAKTLREAGCKNLNVAVIAKSG